YPDLSLSPTIPPRPTGTGEEGPGGQTETMLNPLWPGLELVMAGTSAKVPLPPYHEARIVLRWQHKSTFMILQRKTTVKLKLVVMVGL
ncbi:unnamed protein product, partial [Brassica oleracea var. botrytis]